MLLDVIAQSVATAVLKEVQAKRNKEITKSGETPVVYVPSKIMLAVATVSEGEKTARNDLLNTLSKSL